MVSERVVYQEHFATRGGGSSLTWWLRGHFGDRGFPKCAEYLSRQGVQEAIEVAVLRFAESLGGFVY